MFMNSLTDDEYKLHVSELSDDSLLTLTDKADYTIWDEAPDDDNDEVLQDDQVLINEDYYDNRVFNTATPYEVADIFNIGDEFE